MVFEYVPELLPSLTSLTMFTSCYQRGYTGPPASQCNAYYTTFRDPDKWYKSVTNGIQRLVVPKVSIGQCERWRVENYFTFPFFLFFSSFSDCILSPDTGWCQRR